MKPKLLAVCLVVASIGCAAPQTTHTEQPVTLSFDEELARELGADEYGMARYVVAFLKRGPNQNQTEAEATELQRAHMANIQRLAAAGKLVVAGPFMDDGEIRGIYIFDVATVEEARELTETDPAIQAGRLAMELRPWYGTAAMRQLNATHERITPAARE